MKAVDVNFRKIDIVDYYSQLDQVKVRILFDDGTEKALIKQFSITDPSQQASGLINEIRADLKHEHKVESLDDHPLASALILRFKQEEDVLYGKIAKFLAQVRERIRSGKLAKLSYFDMEKKMKSFSSKLD